MAWQISGGSTPIVNTGRPFAWVYTATGIEGDAFNVPFPNGATLSNTNYIAQVQILGITAQYTVDAPQSGYTTSGIRLECSAQPAPGDQFGIVIQALS